MNAVFKVLGILFFVLFSIGAAVQYNDPDSLIWILIYIGAALLSLGFSFNKIKYSLLLFLGAVCFLGFIYLYPSDFQGFDLTDGDIKTVELGREAFGLLIIAIVMLLFGFRSKKQLKV